MIQRALKTVCGANIREVTDRFQRQFQCVTEQRVIINDQGPALRERGRRVLECLGRYHGLSVSGVGPQFQLSKGRISE